MKIGIKNRLGALEARAEAICEREQDPLSKSLAEFEDFLAEVEDPTATAAEVGLSDEQFTLMRKYQRRYRRMMWRTMK